MLFTTIILQVISFCNWYYYLDIDFDNFLDIEKIDESNGIIKGTFQFKALTKDGKKSIKILNGEFDLKINYWRPIPQHHEFKCLINGRDWEVKQYFTGNMYNHDPLSVFYIKGENKLIIEAFSENRNERFRFQLESVKGIGKVKILEWQEPIFTRGIYAGHILDSTYTNVANILELNEKEEFVKGTFEFRAIKGKGSLSDTITVTNGHFDSRFFLSQ